MPSAAGRGNLGCMTRWVTYLEAARIVGCTPATITNAVRAGHITSRHAGRAHPALDRLTVDQFAQAFAERRDQAGQARRRRAENTEPPDTVHLWLTPAETADPLGISDVRVRQLAQRDRLPHTRRGRRVWIRLDHAEQAAAARGFWG